MVRPGLAMLAAAVLAGTVLAGCGGGNASATSTPANSGTTASQGSPGKPRILDGSFYSDAVKGTLHYSIALPPGYDTGSRRYPVIYVLHGLPSTDQAYKAMTGYADSLAYQGGHDGTFWREHQDEWLAEAVKRLDPPDAAVRDSPA